MHLLRTTARRTLTLIGVLALTFGLAACAGESAGPQEGADVEAIVDEAVGEVEQQVTDLETRVGNLEASLEGDRTIGGAATVTGDVDQYVGEQVTVSGEVGEVVDDNAFIIGADAGVELLIVSATGVGEQGLVEPGAVVQVTGTVREAFSTEEVGPELGVEWDPAEFGDLEDNAYIVADSVTEAPEVQATE